MAFDRLVTLLGSEKKSPRNSVVTGTLSGDEKFTVTVVLHRAGNQPLPPHGFLAHLDRLTFGLHHGAAPEDIELVEQFAHHHGLSVVESSASKRRVTLGGTVDTMRAAFKVDLACYRSESTGHIFRGRSGSISIPEELQKSVVAVLGLDNRPVAKPHFRKKKVTPATNFTPPQVAALYGFPTGVTGAGQTIGIIELGGGYKAADLASYFKALGVTEPKITAVAVDGGANTPGGDADGEVMLDIEVAGSIAPGAAIAVYFAPNTDQGFIDAITDAAHDTARKVTIISISWGGPEDSWTAQSQTALNAALQDAAALGITVTVAAGDDGSSDGETDGALHVDFPASSPFALACGGTTLHAASGKITSETVWNETANKEGATGGGISQVFPLPSYQSTAGVPHQPTSAFAGRGVPDVAGDADPTTGYQVLVDGKNSVIGGTSAVAPLWAALIALCNQKLGSNLGFVNPTLYALQEQGFRDITSGNNDDSNLGFYSAGAGWDPCTGLGSPNGTALLIALSAKITALHTTIGAIGGTPPPKTGA
jgi:kumamolisin